MRKVEKRISFVTDQSRTLFDDGTICDDTSPSTAFYSPQAVMTQTVRRATLVIIYR